MVICTFQHPIWRFQAPNSYDKTLIWYQNGHHLNQWGRRPHSSYALMGGNMLTERHRPDGKVHAANMGPTWVLSAPDGPHVSPMNLAIWVGPVYKVCLFCYKHSHYKDKAVVRISISVRQVLYIEKTPCFGDQDKIINILQTTFSRASSW